MMTVQKTFGPTEGQGKKQYSREKFPKSHLQKLNKKFKNEKCDFIKFSAPLCVNASTMVAKKVPRVHSTTRMMNYPA